MRYRATRWASVLLALLAALLTGCAPKDDKPKEKEPPAATAPAAKGDAGAPAKDGGAAGGAVAPAPAKTD